MALCVVACATYEAVPAGLASDPTDGEEPNGGSSGGGSAGSGSGGGASVAGTGVTPSAGMPAVSTGGTAGGTETSPSGGQMASAGAAGSSGGGVGGGSGGAGGGGSGGTSTSGSGGQGGKPAATDDCPSDPLKTAPGVCGCGVPDADTAAAAGCVGLKTALVHRYDFEGTGTTVTDRVGTAHGVIKGGATLSLVGGKGAVVLSGGTTGPYVDLPNKLISSLTDVTLEAWVTWGGGNAWQRIFDFGDSTNATPEDNPANGKSYLFLTPSTDTASTGVMRGVYSLTGGAVAAETRVEAATAMAQVLAQVALVVDSKGGKLLMYMNGVSAGEQTFAGSLASINDVNAWLGRSQYNADPELTGTFHDFRIYSAALTPLQIATSFAGGPDPAFLSK
jgi:Concanavalin A-like lectin/glucanases superfamily